MQMKMLAAAAALLVSGLASATTYYNAGSYTVSYDETTTFGFISSSWSSSGGMVGFEWSVSDAVKLTNVNGPATSVSFALPSFTLTANPGFELAGSFVAKIGNITYSQYNAVASITANATVNVNNTGDFVLPAASLTKVGDAYQGYFTGTDTLPLTGVNSVQIKNASLTLSSTAGSFLTITGQPQNKLSFAFTAQPVPEPESYALMLAGLGILGFMARRRQQR